MVPLEQSFGQEQHRARRHVRDEEVGQALDCVGIRQGVQAMQAMAVPTVQPTPDANVPIRDLPTVERIPGSSR